ncbi:hypothetical protein BGZ46_000823 [Entomortierella lignicola]|nr:hypothetical protein BGZ46_000823 [Entomortierella lignicola]
MQEPLYVMNPSRQRQTPINLKKPIPDWHLLVRAPMSDSNPRKSNLEKAMEEDLAELRIVMDLFFNARMNEADALLRGRHKPESIYYALGRALVDTVRALLTFNRDDIETAMKSLDQSLKVANGQRRKTSSIAGVGTVKAIGNWVVGTIGASSFKNMTRLEKHAELVYSESLLLRTIFSIVYHQDFWSFLEESVSFRTSLAILNGLKSHFDNVEQELKAGGDISEYYLDEHLVTGLIYSISLFNIAISFLPTSIVKILQFAGFPSDRDWGLALLNSAGQWSPSVNSTEETPFEFQERLASRTNEGMRRQLCDVTMVSIHLIAASFLPIRNVNYNFVEQVTNYNLHRYPDSPFFLFLKARHAQVNARLEESIAIHESIKVQPEWRNLAHASTIEQTMCAIMMGDYDLACTKSRILLRESNWSKAVFRYLVAITTLKRGLPKEAKKVTELMGKVEAGMQSFCGVEVFPETYCSRKAKRFLNEGRLLLPVYDFLVLWNGFDMMPLTYLRVALSNIMVEIQQLDALLPPSMVAIAERPLPKGGYTLEATKGLLGSIRSGIHTLGKADKVKDYDHFYDDYCIAHYLLGIVAQKISLFPDEPFDVDMCALAVKSYKTVFRYAPYVKDDTYMYYFSHFNLGVIMMSQGRVEQAEEKFKYLLNCINPTLTGLPSLMAGKGRNSLDALVLAKAHAAMYLVNEDHDNNSSYSSGSSADGKSSPSSSEYANDTKTEATWSISSSTAVNVIGLNVALGGMSMGTGPGTVTASTASYSDRGSIISSTSPVHPVPSPVKPQASGSINVPMSPVNRPMSPKFSTSPPVNFPFNPPMSPVKHHVNLPNADSPLHF